MQILLSNSQARPGRTVKQEQEEITRNHVQAFILDSVIALCRADIMFMAARVGKENWAHYDDWH